MTYYPLAEVVDEDLHIDASVIDNLMALRKEPKFSSLPGVNTESERERLTGILDELIDSIICGIRSNPTKLWVLSSFQSSLVRVEQEDTEAREHLGMALEEIMDIVGIESSDGLLGYYLGGL